MNSISTTTEAATTTIRLQPKTKNSLVNLGKKNQSYDNIVTSLIAEHYAKALASSSNNKEARYDDEEEGDRQR